jgi:hypothetical protein
LGADVGAGVFFGELGVHVVVLPLSVDTEVAFGEAFVSEAGFGRDFGAGEVGGDDVGLDSVEGEALGG